MCVNEEDGLSFRVLQETTGERHLQVLWDSKEVEDIAKLVDLLEGSSSWPVYQLRATALVQDRVEAQLAQLTESEEEIAWITDQESFNIGSQELHVATKLRTLERALLEKTIEVLETQVFPPPMPIYPFFRYNHLPYILKGAADALTSGAERKIAGFRGGTELSDAGPEGLWNSL